MGKDRERRIPGFLEALHFYTGITMRVGISLLIGFLGGYLLDSQLGTRPWLAIAGFFLGVSLGFWSVYDLVGRTLRQGRMKSRRRRRTK